MRRDVYLKLECAQPSGSFKLRGVGRACALAVERDGARLLVSSSGGNAGLATAHAGRELGAQTVVYVPETTPERVRDALRAYGAEVEVRGTQWSEANAAATARAAACGGAMIHPFEGEDTWDGHSTMMDEIAEDLGATKAGGRRDVRRRRRIAGGMSARSRAVRMGRRRRRGGDGDDRGGFAERVDARGRGGDAAGDHERGEISRRGVAVAGGV